MRAHHIIQNLDYDRNKIKLEQKPPEPPAYKPPPAPEAPETKTPEVPKTETPMPECPTRAQELKNPIGKILEGNKKITGYELVGKECIEVTEQLEITDQIISNIPNAGAVTVLRTDCSGCTTSALLCKTSC